VLGNITKPILIGIKFIAYLLIACVCLGATIFDVMEKDAIAEKYRKEEREQRDSTNKLITAAADTTKQALSESIREMSKQITQHSDSNFESNKTVLVVPKKPFIDLAIPPGPSQPNPWLLQHKDNNKLLFNVVICNTGNDHAIEIMERVLALTYRSDILVSAQPPFQSTSNKSISLRPDPKEAVARFSFGIENQYGLIKDYSYYIFFRVTYKNSDGRAMNPLRKVFSISEDKISEARSVEYDKVELDLKKRGFW
jgi:hypothetical protein